MYHLEFLLEEPSMENVLREILPKILPENYKEDEHYFLRPHQGKKELEKSIPNKMKASSRSSYRDKVVVIILHDQDRTPDCKKLKEDLSNLCKENGSCPFLIRIVCKELEAWYLGDMEAISAAYPHFKYPKYQNKEKFRNPDLCNAADELKKILPEFQKITSSKRISRHMDINRNGSPSFNAFVKGLKDKINS